MNIKERSKRSDVCADVAGERGGIQLILWFLGGECIEFKMPKKYLEEDFKWLVGMYSYRAQDIYKVKNTAVICLNIDNT